MLSFSLQAQAEKDRLRLAELHVVELRKKVAQYDCRNNLGFFDMEPLIEEGKDLREQLQVAKEETARLKAIAEPPPSFFKKAGAFTLAVDLAIGEALSKAHVSRNQVPLLFMIFARFFRVKLPTHMMKVPHKKINGRMTYIEREMQYIPGRTHVKAVCATLNQAHKLQMGVELLENIDSKYCYIADGAESLQSEWLCQLLSRRDPATGQLHVTSLDLSLLHSKTSEAQAAAFKESLKLIAELLKDMGITDEVSPRILNFRPASSMNDRAAAARKAARLVRGAEVDDPSCAHHAITNIFEEGRKAVDKLLRALMNISDEQAAADAAKVKAMRTSVGWFSSPACAVIYQTAKYVALFSSKGYAVGSKFRIWLEAEEEERKKEAGVHGEQLLGFVEDLLAICGSRDYVFFMDAAVTERFSQDGSLKTFLEEEADLGGEAGGKLRNTILTGFGSDEIMAAVRSLALICDACLWPLLRSIGSNKHILDVLPVMWPQALAFFKEAASSPQHIMDGSLELLLSCDREAKLTERAKRSAVDMQRIRAKVAGNELIAKMLTAAFNAMAEATSNHASEFLSGGALAAEVITAEHRERLSGCPMTSIGAERVFALGRFHDKRAGASRDDTRQGLIQTTMDDTTGFMRQRENAEEEWAKLRARANKGMLVTMQQKRLEVGQAERVARQEKLAAKRAKRTARNAEKARVQAVKLATKYSELKSMSNDDLKDQLKKHKLLGKTGFTVSLPNRTALVLQLQALLNEADPVGANDLDDGDSGIDGRAIRRKAAPSVRGGKNKRKKTVQTYMGYEFDNTADYNLDAIVGHIVTDGDSVYANQVRPPALPSHVRSLTPSLPLAGQDAQGSQALSMRVGGLPPGRGVVRDRGERRRHHRLRAVPRAASQRRERGGCCRAGGGRARRDGRRGGHASALVPEQLLRGIRIVDHY